MGEEAAAETPFLFFCDWQGEAAELTREGRRKEFAHFKAFATPELRDRIPDPCDESAFLASKLDWGKIGLTPISRNFRELTKELLRLREQKIVPLIKDHILAAKGEVLGKGGRQGGLNVQWQTAKGDELQIVTSFSQENLPMPRLIDGETIWRSSHSSDMALRHDQIVVRRSPRIPG
jgi:maltooligosyltrehalose trehalohydrolase